jgi:hypothetical protein
LFLAVPATGTTTRNPPPGYEFEERKNGEKTRKVLVAKSSPEVTAPKSQWASNQVLNAHMERNAERRAAAQQRKLAEEMAREISEEMAKEERDFYKD